MKIENGIIEGNLDINKSNLDEFIKNIHHIKEINGYLNLSNLNLKELPDLSNIIINGGFDCSNNKLTSLNGCPAEIGGHFYCAYNQLTSLIGCPTEIGGHFWCNHNKLTSLNGCPKIIKEVAIFDKNVILSKEILNIINNLSKYKDYLNKEDVLHYLREIQLVKILDSHEVGK